MRFKDGRASRERSIALSITLLIAMGSPTALTAAPLPSWAEEAPPTGQACRPLASAFWLIFETTPEALDQLLGDRTFWVHARKGAPFTAGAVRKKLETWMQPRSDSLFLSAAFVQYTADPRPGFQANPKGTGILAALERRKGKTFIAACVIGEVAEAAGVEVELSTSDLLLLRLSLEGKHYLAAIRAPYLDPADFESEQARYRAPFEAGLKGQTSPPHWMYLRPSETHHTCTLVSG